MKTVIMIAFLFMGQPYHIDLAITPFEHATGMMYRKEWTHDNQGMLFINDKPRTVSFWMKNTYLALTLFYLDPDFNIVEIHQGQALDETSISSSSTNIQYILELNPALEGAVTTNWDEFKGSMLEALSNKQKDIDKLKRPL